MWMNQLLAKPAPREALQGKITLKENGITGVSDCQETRDALIMFPYGYQSVPVEQSDVLVIPIENQSVIAGVLTQQSSLAPGEIELRGNSGASIRLCADGSILLNGIKITAEGVLLPKEGGN